MGSHLPRQLRRLHLPRGLNGHGGPASVRAASGRGRSREQSLGGGPRRRRLRRGLLRPAPLPLAALRGRGPGRPAEEGPPARNERAQAAEQTSTAIDGNARSKEYASTRKCVRCSMTVRHLYNRKDAQTQLPASIQRCCIGIACWYMMNYTFSLMCCCGLLSGSTAVSRFESRVQHALIPYCPP